MGYWTETDDYLRRHGSGPKCPSCGQTMFPQDDHGRFACFCSGRSKRTDVVSKISSVAPEVPDDSAHAKKGQWSLSKGGKEKGPRMPASFYFRYSMTMCSITI